MASRLFIGGALVFVESIYDRRFIYLRFLRKTYFPLLFLCLELLELVLVLVLVVLLELELLLVQEHVLESELLLDSELVLESELVLGLRCRLRLLFLPPPFCPSAALTSVLGTALLVASVLGSALSAPVSALSALGSVTASPVPVPFVLYSSMVVYNNSISSFSFSPFSSFI